MRRISNDIGMKRISIPRNLSVRESIVSFTLIELLIVIGILAILTAATVLVLNPGERLQEARDSRRIQELTSLEKSISLLLTQNPSVSMGTASTVYVSIPDTSATCANLGLPALSVGYAYNCVTAANLRNTNGTGWIPINFSSSPVSSLPQLPVDPTNATSSGLYYTYMTGGSFELTALMESEKKSAAAVADGGMLTGVLQKGTHIDLTPPTRDRGLAGYWAFDEGSGTNAGDSSGNNNSGTLTNGPTWQSGANCKIKGCLSFSAALNTSVLLPNSLKLTGAHTLLMWVKRTGSEEAQTVFGGQGLGSHKGGIVLTYYNPNGRYYYDILNGVPTRFAAVESLASTDSNWNFIAATWDGTSAAGSMKLYTNGILRNSTAGSPTALDWTESPTVQIGNSGGWSGYNFTGSLDDVRLYNRALTTTEIQAIYTATK